MIEVPEGRPSSHALKPLPIQDDLHGPEGPLLHGCANIPEFFKQNCHAVGAFSRRFAATDSVSASWLKTPRTALVRGCKLWVLVHCQV